MRTKNSRSGPGAPRRRSRALVFASLCLSGAIPLFAQAAAPFASFARVTSRVNPAAASVARDRETSAEWDALARDFREYTERDRVVGASMVLLTKGKIEARAVAGERNRAAKLPVDSLTIFHWGSITKSLTAIAIMQLRDRGRLSLDDKIIRYVPELRQLHDPFGMLDSITIRMLLSHSAGFRNGTWPYGDGQPWEPFEPTSWNQLVAMMPYQALLFRPGTRYGYSNPAFIYLARVIEQLTGDPWESYIHKNIFAPLSMHHSYFRSTPYYLASERSHNYSIRKDSASGGTRVVDHGADFDPGITTPNGGWNSPIGDLAIYTAFLTNSVLPGGSRAHYDAVLSRSSLEEMWRPVVPMTDGYEASTGQSMGLSFFIRGSGAQRVLGHTGSQAGFRAFYYFNPATGTAVIAGFNTTNYAAPAVSELRKLSEGAQRLVAGGAP